MTVPPDPYSTDGYVLLDATVLRDIADALDGRWNPADERDPIRRARLLAAARLRLYGDRDRSGWYLVSHRMARDAAMTRGNTEWSVGFIPEIDGFPDAPVPDEVAALARLFSNGHLSPESASALAHAVLYEPVRMLVSVDVRPFRHSREGDLPERLELVTAVEAVERLGLAPGEAPPHGPPGASPLASQDAWWVP